MCVCVCVCVCFVSVCVFRVCVKDGMKELLSTLFQFFGIGKHVLCEARMASNAKEAHEMFQVILNTSYEHSS